jgi:hypothetical protein
MNPLLLGGIFETVGNLLDDLHTSDKEKLDAQLELGKLSLENKKLDQAIQLGQIEVNKEEAKSLSWFTSGWRPAVGWACVGGLVYQLMFRPIFGWVAQNIGGWTMPPSLEIETLMTLLFGMLGLGAYRTAEKVKGVAH